jgi:hypothetical protein
MNIIFVIAFILVGTAIGGLVCPNQILSAVVLLICAAALIGIGLERL